VIVLTGGRRHRKTTDRAPSDASSTRRRFASLVLNPFLSVDDCCAEVLLDFGVIFGETTSERPGGVGLAARPHEHAPRFLLSLHPIGRPRRADHRRGAAPAAEVLEQIA
jgi:hypothetical protein